ncbi:MAG: diguanylate cyclase [Chloroflexota bacterium]
MIFSTESKHRIFRLLIAFSTIIILVVTVAVNALLRRSVEVSERAEIALLRLQSLASRLSALEWRAIGEQELSSEVADDALHTREEMDQIIQSLAEIDPGAEHLQAVQQAFLAYTTAVDEEFDLLAAGNIEQARRVDEERVDPAFDEFSQALALVRDDYHSKVLQMEQASDIGSIAVPLFATVALAVLFWQFQRAQAVIHAANIEQRALSQGQETFHLLNEMGNWLQACHSTAEAYDIVASFSQRLFPFEAGVLFIYNSSRNLLEAVTTWGDFPAGMSSTVLSPDDCWALRRTQIYIVEDTSSQDILCQHVCHPGPESYLCVPMMAQSEILGVLHLQRSKSTLPAGARSPDSGLSAKRQLAVTVAEHVALALKNLKLQDSLRDQAIRDPLTGLFNRRYMEESLERELARALRRQTSVGVVMLDIDHFKLFNDTFGHSAGDKVLIELSSLMQLQIRREDIACRFGGEEFVLVLPDASLQDTCRRAEQLRSDVQHLSVMHKGQLLGAITLSLGVSNFPDHGDTVEALLAAADSALYNAKAGGRNRLIVAGTGSG